MSREELLKAVEKIRNKSRIGNNKHYHEVIKPNENLYKPFINKIVCYNRNRVSNSVACF